MSIQLKGGGTREIPARNGVTFWVRPEAYQDVVYATHKMVEMGGDLKMTNVVLGAGVGFSVISRIERWQGVTLPDGSDAPCDDAHKENLFGQRPDLLQDLIRELVRQEAAEAKNLQTSPDGKSTTTRQCAPPVSKSMKKKAGNRRAKRASTTPR
jgi:hypothetical protein